jgi:predicted membrane protein
MKIDFFSSELFWGSLLLLFGLSMIIKTIFGIDIPVIRTLVAVLLIYSGITLITGLKPHEYKKRHTTAFKEATISPEKADDFYSIYFGRGIVDLKNIDITKTQKVKINTVFGESIIKINPHIPMKIKVQVTFGSAQLPDDTHISSGKYTYSTDRVDHEPYLLIEATVAFGSLVVITQ